MQPKYKYIEELTVGSIVRHRGTILEIIEVGERRRITFKLAQRQRPKWWKGVQFIQRFDFDKQFLTYPPKELLYSPVYELLYGVTIYG